MCKDINIKNIIDRCTINTCKYGHIELVKIFVEYGIG